MSGRVRVSGAGEAAAEPFGEGWHVPGDSLGERGDGERRQHGAAHGGGAPRLDGLARTRGFCSLAVVRQTPSSTGFDRHVLSVIFAQRHSEPGCLEVG